MRYRPEIDGLRAVAVVTVVLFHAGFDWFSGGYVGVDIFFVISGYLITTIIVDELQGGRFSLTQFYERRARRILPALFFVIICTLPPAWWLLQPGQMTDFGQSVTATALFSSNVLFWLESDYFATTAELKPLLHTWSLAVEEQYYILFPLVLMALWRFGANIVLLVIAAIFLASLTASYWSATAEPNAGFFLLPFRAWELMLGSFCAFLVPRLEPQRLRDDLASALGLGAIIWSVLVFDSKTPFPGIHALLPTMGAALVIVCGVGGTFVKRILSAPGMVAIGLISYSGYLWHQPVFSFYRHFQLHEPSGWVMGLLALVSMSLAWFSWRFVETPFRDRKRFTRKTVFSLSAAAILLLSAVGIYIQSQKGLLFQSVENDQPVQYELDNQALQEESWRLLREISGNEHYVIENNDFDQTVWFDSADSRSKLLLVGNSHSKDLFNIFYFSRQIGKEFEIARYGVQIGDLTDRNHEFYESGNYELADVVVISSLYRKSELGAVAKVVEMLKTDSKSVVLVNNIFEFEEYGDRTLADVLFLEAQASQSIEDPVRLAERINREHFERYRRNESRRADVLPLINRRLREIAAQADLPLLDRMEYVCSTEERACYALGQNYQKHFYDYGHHTLAGARFFAARIEDIGWLEVDGLLD